MRRSDLYLTTRLRKGLRFKSNQSVAEAADLGGFYWSYEAELGQQRWLLLSLKRSLERQDLVDRRGSNPL